MQQDNQLIQLNTASKKQLRDLGVEALYLFGSRAQGVAGPLSDYDFGVLMKKIGYKRGGKLYDKLYDSLAPLCPRNKANDVIDIIFLRDAPLELKFHVIHYGQILFESDPQARLKFEEQTTLYYADFKPLLNLFDQAVLKAI